MRPLLDRFVVGLADAPIAGRTAAAPPWVVVTLPLVIVLRIIVLLPLGFLSRASTVLSLTSLSFCQRKGYVVDQC